MVPCDQTAPDTFQFVLKSGHQSSAAATFNKEQCYPPAHRSPNPKWRLHKAGRLVVFSILTPEGKGWPHSTSVNGLASDTPPKMSTTAIRDLQIRTSCKRKGHAARWRVASLSLGLIHRSQLIYRVHVNDIHVNGHRNIQSTCGFFSRVQE